METFPYVMSPSKIPDLFKKIGSMGIPARFSNSSLKSLGFTSSNDYRLLHLLKFIGFVDTSGAPATRWSKDFREDQAAAIAQGVQAGYADLFQHYPDAHQRDDEALRTYFAANSKVGAAAVGMMMSTFKATSKLGRFSDTDRSGDLQDTQERSAQKSGPLVKELQTSPKGGQLTLNINVQLQLPTDPTGETYEKFFLAMKKHFLDFST